MHLDEPNIDDSDSAFLSKKLILLHMLEWIPQTYEKLSRYYRSSCHVNHFTRICHVYHSTRLCTIPASLFLIVYT
jgi:hypothetical protein